MKKVSKVIKTVVGDQTAIQGNIAATESIRIDGNVKGMVKTEGMLIVSKTAKVIGDVYAQSIIIGGIIEGNLYIQDKVEAYAKAQIKGNISAKSLSIDEDVIFEGNCSINKVSDAEKTEVAETQTEEVTE